MRLHSRTFLAILTVLLALFVIGCGGGSTTSNSNPPPSTFQVSLVGPTSASGTVTSTPAGISCPSTCTGSFAQNTQVTFTATAASGYSFTGWAGVCTGTTSTCTITVTSAVSITANFTQAQPQPQLTVTVSGPGSVTSNPSGINCPSTCTAVYPPNTVVTLTEVPSSGSAFTSWGGACSGTSNTCVVTMTAAMSVAANFGSGPTLQSSINHIIFMAQENRGFDHYFGAMRQYWAANGFSDQSFDGLPEFNPVSGMPPLQGAKLSNPGCDPAFPPPNDCTIDSSSPSILSFHPLDASGEVTMCMENPSPSWNEDHVDMNYNDPTMSHSTVAPLDGFVYTAAHDARANNPPFYDTDGYRAMTYYDGNDLPYYYFMASSFATSDRWFSPVMSRTQPNRMYSLAATSNGYAYPIPPGGSPLANPTIFDVLQAHGISWKIYVTDLTYANPQIQDSSLNMFTTAAKYPQNIVPVSQFLTDVKNGTLPAVAYIDPGFDSGLDEHPGVDDSIPGAQIQVGAEFVSTLINGLMASPSWSDSVFILTYDEFGGFADHVPPQPTVSPDGITPQDLRTGAPFGPDVCTTHAPDGSLITGPTCDFVYTGYRVPLVVISPFTKKNYVSHTVTDYTAWLKLVETRFNLPSLTKRDAAQMDMTEFFDFTNEPWKTPPTPPNQPTNGACSINPPPHP